MDTKSLGRKLRAYRAKCGWNLDECSERIGISTRYLAVGYEVKSNDIARKLNALDVTRRKQALDIFDGVICSLKEN